MVLQIQGKRVSEMDRRANVKWIYAISVVLIITNAAAGVSGNKPRKMDVLKTYEKMDDSSRRVLMTDDPDSGNRCCLELRGPCKCTNMVKTSEHEFQHVFPIRTINGTVELQFKVKADRDANLVFFAEDRRLAYEIILGANSNTLSYIRKLLGVKSKQTWLGIFEDEVEYAEYKWADVVSPNEWREFWVQIKDDTVKVGRKDENAFMEIKDVTNVPVMDYSVAGWYYSHVMWSLPCTQEKDFSW